MKILLNILITLFLLLPLSSAWSLEKCPGSPLKTKTSSIPSTWDNCKGKHTISNENKHFTYIGKYLDGKRNGHGVAIYLSGDQYIGKWKNNKREGIGSLYSVSSKGSHVYVGEWKEDKFHGKGVRHHYGVCERDFLYTDEDEVSNYFLGEYKNGKRHGKGVYFLCNGQVEVVFFKEGELIKGVRYAKYAKGKYQGPKASVYLAKYIESKNIIQDEFNLTESRSTIIAEDDPINDQNRKFLNKQKVLFSKMGENEQNQKTLEKEQWKNSEEVILKKITTESSQLNKNITQIILDVSHKTPYKTFTLKGSKPRLVIDIDVGNGNNFKVYNTDKLIKNIRTRKDPDKPLRIVFDLNKKAYIRQHLYLPIQKNSPTIQLLLDIEEYKHQGNERELAETKAEEKKEKKRISSDIEPPQIVISSTNVKDKRGTIKGIVSDNFKVAELTVDGEIVIFDRAGHFNYSTFIPPDGKNLTIQATDSKGLSNKKIVALQRKVTSAERTLNFTELNPLKFKGKKNENALALIIGVNNYIYAPEAKYADRDASYFADFANNILGVSEENIKTLKNTKASETEIKIALKKWLKGYSTPNKSDIYIFFAGHGLASTDGKELYLLPYDGEPRLLEDTALLRSEIFDTIKSIKPKSVTVFLDTCYSGQTRNKDMILADARPIAIVPVESDVPENFTVFSASSGSEISGSLPEADHGLFSYFLMKGLEGDADANNDNKITNGELHSYVRSNVTRQAVRLGREQTPQLQGDENRVLVEFN